MDDNDIAVAQLLGNRIGNTQRSLEEAMAKQDHAEAQMLAHQLHRDLARGYAFLRDKAGLALDWDQLAGNAPANITGLREDAGAFVTGDRHKIEPA